MPGADEVAKAEWIEAAEIRDSAAVARGIEQTGLGAGEVSTVILANEILAELILIDELRGRRFARASGFEVIGCIGVLEILYQRSEILICVVRTCNFWPARFGSIFLLCSEAWRNSVFRRCRFGTALITRAAATMAAKS